MKEKEFQSNELNNKQLEQVSGGANTNSFNEGPKYQDHQKVRFFSHIFYCDLDGEVLLSQWSALAGQYEYSIDFPDQRLIFFGGQEMYTGVGGEYVLEEDIHYDK